MKKGITLGMILLIFPLCIMSQDRQIIWDYITPNNTGHIIDLKNTERIVFYNDNTFENMTLDPGHIGGKGNYVVTGSIVKCIYNGEAAEKDKGIVEIKSLDTNKENLKITVKNHKGESLPGANIFLKTDQDELLNKFHTDFDGVVSIPKKELGKVTVEFIGYKSINVNIPKETNGNITVSLAECCPNSVIAKGSEQQFEIVTDENNKSSLKLIDSNIVLYNH
ncbi:MAG: hypothetical protein R3299_02135 [Arenibacter sp.]|nr:hypothetical protein [Arenibacter sp.]